MVATALGGVVFDLDGVIRHYDRVHEREIEGRYRLTTGVLFSAAFGGELGRRFMRGEIDHDQFADAIGEAVGSANAAAEFVAIRAVVDPAAVHLVRAVRRHTTVALLTNGSRRTHIELEHAGLLDAFDHIFNSADTGIPKPEPGAYTNVAAALGVAPSATMFIDDHPPNVAGAVAVGMIGHHFTGLQPLRASLGDHGFNV